MITFIAATITFVFIISWFYVFLRSDLKGLLGHSVALVLLVLLNVVALLMSISFMLASITPSPFDAQIYTRFAIILFRLGTVLLFIFSETGYFYIASYRLSGVRCGRLQKTASLY